MKAEVAQQRSLLELSELDAEMSRITHRANRLPQREAGKRCGRVRVEWQRPHQSKTPNKLNRPTIPQSAAD